jgi:hypothetical protein
VSGIFRAGQLRSEGIVQVGVNPPAGATVAVDGTLRATGNISTTAALRANDIVPLTGSTMNVANLAVAGDLALGEWRLRNETGAFHLDRFDDDGALVTDAWLNVASFAHNADNNVPGLDVANLGVPGTATVGTLAVTGDLTTTGTARCDVFKGRHASEVTCQDNLTVTGVLECQDNVAVTGQVAAQSMFCNTDLTVLGNIFGWSPLVCAGRVDAVAVTATSVGRVGFTVSRPTGFPAGVFRIAFAIPAPNNNYVVSLTLFATGINLDIRLWNSTDLPGRIPSTTSFHVVTARENAVANLNFHFAVLL